MSDGSTQQPARWLSWAGTLGVGLLLVLVFLLAWYHFLNAGPSFNSDHLYCLHFCDDLLHGRDLRGWHLPAAPYLFPDMLLLSGIMLLTSDVATVYFLYSALNHVLLLVVLTTLFHLMGVSRRQAFTTAALGLMLLLATCLQDDYGVRSLLLQHPGNHLACQLIGLAATALVLHTLTRGYRGWSAVLLVLVCGLCGFSDQLLIVQYLAPIGAASLALALLHRVPMRRVVHTALLLACAVGLAMTKEKVLAHLGLVPMRLKPSYQIPSLAALKELVTTFWAAFHKQVSMLTVLALHLTAALTVALLWIRRGRRGADAAAPEAAGQKRPQRDTAILFVVLVLLLAPLSNAGGLVVTKMVNYSTLDRYLYNWLLLPFLCIAVWPLVLPWRPAVRLVPVAILIVVLTRLYTFPDPIDRAHAVRRYPPLARALDEMVRKHGRLRGFGDYWRAREMHYLTHEHIDVLPIVPWGNPWFHGYNPNAFLAEDRRDLTLPDYHFVILPTAGAMGPDAEHIRLLYGDPVEVIPAGDHAIWRYERLNNRRLEMFLRAQLAQRLVEQKPFVGPSEPACLARPKRNLNSCRARGTVHLSPQDTLTLRFDNPATGAMIDLAAQHSDQYLLRFFRAGEELGETRVSAVDWNGAEIAYGPPGLQSRLVPVPAACRESGFDEVRVFPFGRSQEFTLGHFLVFNEWIPYRSDWGRPEESYHRFEGEKLVRMDSPHVTTVADASASAGQVRQATAAFQGYMAYGPYLPLTPGRYRVDFALKVEDNAGSDPVATLDACAFVGEHSLAVRTLRGSDFAAADRYRVFSLTFDTEEALDRVEFRVFVPGKTKVSLDYVDVTRQSPLPTSEVCEP